MINDEYLIGCLMLAQSIRQFKESNGIDLICMVTPGLNMFVLVINTIILYISIFILVIHNSIILIYD